MSVTVSDKRVLELYLNYAQFGPQLYGVCAATWYYFDSPPWDVSEYQSAQLIGLLPAKSLAQRAPGGGIDTSERAHPLSASMVTGAADSWVPMALGYMNGWRDAVATIGIDDEASDYAPFGDPDGCATMPDAVRELLTLEASGG